MGKGWLKFVRHALLESISKLPDALAVFLDMPTRGLFARGVPPLPKLFIYIEGLIILLSIIILALAGYAQSLSGNYYYESGVPAFLLFVSIWSLLVYGGMIVIEIYTPQFYHRIGVLVGQLLSVIFWISGWAWSASSADYILSFDNYSSHDSIRGAWKAFGQSIAACAGIGALVWVFCIVAVVVFCSACRRSAASVAVTTIELTNTPKSNVPQSQTASPSPRAPDSGLPPNVYEVS